MRAAITTEAIVAALKDAGQYGYGGGLAAHTWPLSLEELRCNMGLPKERKPELQRALRQLRKRAREVGVFYAFYPTGWRFDPRVIRPS